MNFCHLLKLDLISINPAPWSVTKLSALFSILPAKLKKTTLRMWNFSEKRFCDKIHRFNPTHKSTHEKISEWWSISNHKMKFKKKFLHWSTGLNNLPLVVMNRTQRNTHFPLRILEGKTEKSNKIIFFHSSKRKKY